MAREDRGTGGPPTGGAVLPTAGCTENLTPGSTERPPGGKQEAQGLETAVCDSVDWPDSGGRIVGYFADPAPVSYQAPVVDLLWAWCGDQFQRRSRGCERPTPTEEEAYRSEEHTSELQSRQYLVCRLLLEKKKYMRRRSFPTRHRAPQAACA